MFSNSNAHNKTSTFDINKHIASEMREMNREYIEYSKIKSYYGFNKKRSNEEMQHGDFKIYSPEPSELPFPSEKILNKN